MIRSWPVFVAGHSLGGKVALEYVRLLQTESNAEHKLPKQVDAFCPGALCDLLFRSGFWIRNSDRSLPSYQPIRKWTRLCRLSKSGPFNSTALRLCV